MNSITIRLNEGEYGLLKAKAVAEEVSPTSLVKSLVLDSLGSGRNGSAHEPIPCVRAARHRPGVPCPLCGAS